ncbi:CAP domain-containing protein [Croceiramulus getboli]|nr:CAP domain-containing protein [Flavobacteriaceae bacterium YJPT1-3]
MNLITRSLFALAFLCFAVSCSQDKDTVQDSVDLSTSVSELNHQKTFSDEILVLVNEHRESMGLNALEKDIPVVNEAVKHSEYMIEQQKISHDNFFDRADHLKDLGAARVSENVAFGYKTAREVVDAWIGSEGHRRTLEGDYTHTGIGVLASTGGQTYFTHIFVKK